MQEAPAKLLIKWGADPDIYDNDGVSPKQVARFNPRILARIHSRQVTNRIAVGEPFWLFAGYIKRRCYRSCLLLAKMVHTRGSVQDTGRPCASQVDAPTWLTTPRCTAAQFATLTVSLQLSASHTSVQYSS